MTFKDPVMTRAFFAMPPPGAWFDYETAWEVAWSVVPSLSNPKTAYITGLNFTWNTLGSYVLADDLIFHCEEETDVIIDLVAMGDLIYWTYDETGTKTGSQVIAAGGTTLDSIHVVQVIPEPATVVLLGLGSLSLMRRRRNRN